MMSITNHKSLAKKVAGEEAAKLIQDQSIVGLGTGSTAYFFINALIRRCEEGLKIKAVSSSEASAKQAIAGGIEVIDLNELAKIDVTVDGADEIDPEKRMIKGGGGALLREKIVASASDEMIIVIDESKVVSRLGAYPIPVEVNPFGYKLTKRRIETHGFRATVREKEGKIYITDNGNYILDLQYQHLSGSPEEHDQVLKSIPGILETGFFFGLAGRVIVGDSKGKVKIWT